MAVELDEFERPVALPRYLTRFTGRERELAQLYELLAQSGERLISIAGPGGVGKTRLLVEALDRLLDRSAPFELLFVDGAAIERAGDLLSEIAMQLGLEQQGGVSSGEQVSEYLADRPLLLALDNMEHLVDAAIGLAILLRACPGLRIVATTRTPLRLSGECLVNLEPLATGNAATHWSPAAVLFLDRARLANATLDLAGLDRGTIEEICRQLDGLPLALELAAARLRFLSPDALLLLLTNQLAVLGGGPVDASERHKTLRAAIAWSVALLDEGDQRLFRRLGVFPDSFSLEAAEDVSLRELPARQRTAATLDGLASLFDQGLIQRVSSTMPGQVRFRMLVSIRELALDLLASAGELEGANEALARYVERFVGEQAAELTGPGQPDAMSRLAAEHAAIGGAFDWAVRHPEDPIGLLLIGGMWRFWSNRGLLHDGRAAIDRVLVDRPIESTSVWAAALRGAAVIAELQTDWPAALAWGTAAIEIWEQLDDDGNLARSLVDYGNVQSSTGAMDQARSAYERAATHAARAHDERMETVARCSLGTVALRQGNLEDADAQYALALPFMRRSGDQWLLAMTLSNRAIAQCRLGRQSDALAALQECLLLRRELGDELGVGYALLIKEEAEGDEAIGGNDAREALEIAQRLGVSELIGPAMVNLAVGNLRKGDTPAAAELLGTALRRCQEAGNPVFVAESIELIAELAEPDDPRLAARLLGGTAACREQQGVLWRGQFSARAQSLQQRLMATLGASGYWAEHRAGAIIPLQMLVVDALVDAQRVARAGPISVEEPVVHELLTMRELAVLRLLAEGKSDRAIGSELFISPKTANRHVMSILAKLECRNRTAATALAYRLGLV